MMKTRRVLIVEDEHALALALATVVVRAGAEPVKVASGAQALEELRAGGFSLVIIDIGLPDMNGLEVLRKAFPAGDEFPLPVLVITAHGNLENAIAARKLGVADYLVKPLDLSAFQEVLGRLLKPVRVGGDGAGPGPGSDQERETTLIGGAAAMQPVFRDVAHACSVSLPVVISGSTGVGKSLAARVIHANGGRGAGELFSIKDPVPAGGGSLLVEDVDALADSDQQKLLGLLDSRPDVRVIATTRRSLHQRVTGGQFREDLYYRLNVLEIRLPDLVDRLDDLPALAQYFLGRATSERALVFSAEVIKLLQQHTWPGNILELRNAVEYSVGVCRGSQILPQHMPALVSLDRAGDGGALVGSIRAWLADVFEEKAGSVRYADLIGHLEGTLLLELLRRFDGKPTRLAAALDMNRTTLRKKCADLVSDRDGGGSLTN